MAALKVDPSALARARVLVVGDVMLDRFVYGRVSRISPEAPIPVMEFERETAMPGGAGNVARNVASLGAQASLVGLIGKDAAGEELQNVLLGTPGIKTCLVVDDSRPTSQKTRFIGGRQQLLRTDREITTEPRAASIDALIEATINALPQTDVVIVSDYAKGVIGERLLAALMAAASRDGKKVLVDPKGKDFSRFQGAALLTPNQNEAALATGLECTTDEQAAAAARALLRVGKIGAVLITRGAAGMTLVEGTGAPLHLKAEAREVFDVSGAGDTAMAALAVAVAGGLGLPDAARLANLAAGIAVGKAGTAIVRPEELRLALNLRDLHDIEAKIAAPERAADVVAKWREQGDRVGFTNGCFDLLHAGHLALLSDARARCDRLIVAINADASVRKLKGPDRPVQSELHRARVLAALALVDLVIIFAEDTPVPLLLLLRPDLLIKGGDYAIEQVVGADIVRAYGGQVAVSRLVEGESTTATIRRLRG